MLLSGASEPGGFFQLSVAKGRCVLSRSPRAVEVQLSHSNLERPALLHYLMDIGLK